MFDIVAAIYATAYCSAQVGLLIGFSPVRGPPSSPLLRQRRPGSRLSLPSTRAGVAAGQPRSGSGEPVAVHASAHAAVRKLVSGSAVSEDTLSVPLAALVAVHAGRIGGVFFCFSISMDDCRHRSRQPLASAT
ncbi:hypothetical protein ACF1BQ_042860 [Bradyrhizobium sp. RDT10]